jgi:hypothetical protein
VKRALLLVIPVAALVGFAPLKVASSGWSNAPTPLDLPNDCGIVASEAASRLMATGAWTRIVQLKFSEHGQLLVHAIVVWRPPTTSHVWAYDEYLLKGSLDTGVVLREQQQDLPAVILAVGEASRRQLSEPTYCQ